MINSARLTKPGDWRCPNCRELLNGFTGEVSPEQLPNAGDLSVCCHCFHTLEFLDNGFQLLSQEKYEALPVELKVKLCLYQEAARRTELQR